MNSFIYICFAMIKILTTIYFFLSGGGTTCFSMWQIPLMHPMQLPRLGYDGRGPYRGETSVVRIEELEDELSSSRDRVPPTS